MKKGIFLSLLLPLASLADYKIHVLKEGETLSGLLETYGHSPLYTKEGWVKKTLELNHLTANQAKDLKKGFPVILPNHEVSGVKEKVIYKNRFITRYKEKKTKYFGISKHQNVQFRFLLGRQQYQFQTAENLTQEIYQGGLHVVGQNDYSLGRLKLNYQAGLGIKTYGPALNNDGDQSISLRPDYQVSTGVLAKTDGIPFQFGLTLAIEEKSLIESNQGLELRRDQNVYLGFTLDQKYSLQKTDIHSNISYQQNIIQDPAKGFERYEASQIDLKLGLNLTKNTIAGLSYNQTNFEKAQIQNVRSGGLNFIYLIK